MVLNLRVRPIQIIFLIIFVLLNCSLYLLSEKRTIDGISYDATYHNASDGQRYWGTGINLVKKYQFSIPKHLYGATDFKVDPPLARATPLPAIVFSIPIKLVGFNNASAFIVLIQITLLFVMGLLIGQIGGIYGTNRSLVQGLIIFNPNLIGLAHHAQSDFLFSFIFSVIIWFASRIISNPDNLKMLHFLTVGLACGLLVLTRPVGYYYANLFPVLLLVSIFMCRRAYRTDIKKVLIFLALSMMVMQSTITPWMLRNYKTFGDFSITQKEKSVMLDTQYDLFFLYNNIQDRDTRKKEAMSKAERSLAMLKECTVKESEGELDPLVKRERGHLCEILFNVGVLSSLLSEPPSQLFRAFLTGWTGLFLGGGAGTLQKYLGLGGDNQFFIFRDFTGFNSFVSYFSENLRQVLSFLLIVVPTVGFSVLTRIAGLVGLIALLRNRRNLPILVFHLSSLIFLIAICMFYSLVRYRAPMEPILMLLGAVGLARIFRSRSKEYPETSKLTC